MNYYDARELKSGGQSTGKWHYTKRNDDQIWPVGYCAEECPGHDTALEARRHYTEYLLDNRLRLDGTYAGAQYECAVCKEFTGRYGSVDGRDYALCDRHRTRDHLAALYGTVGQITSSS